MTNTALALRIDAQSRLQSRPAQDHSNRSAARLHCVASNNSVAPVADEHATERAVPQLAKSTHEIREKLHNALKRRIGLGKPVSVKMVAQATGLTERTVENSMSGETMPRGDTLMSLVDFFDASFANEVFAGTTFMVVKLSDQRAADAARMINDGVAALQALARRA